MGELSRDVTVDVAYGAGVGRCRRDNDVAEVVASVPAFRSLRDSKRVLLTKS